MLNRNRSGFGMLEVIVSLGMVGIASVALMDVMRGFTQSASESDRKAQIQSMIGEIQTSLASQGDCLADLKNAAGSGGLTVDPSTATSTGQQISVRLKDDSATVLTNGLVTSLFPKIIPVKIQLKDLQLVNGTASTYTGRVTLIAAPTAGSNKTMDQYIERSVMSLYMTLDASNNVQSCYAANNATDMQALCGSLSGTWNATTMKCLMDQQTQCQSFGGTWANGLCSTNGTAQCQRMGGMWDPPTASCQTATNPQSQCTQLGGSWNGSSCSVPGPTECANMHGTWINGACTMTANPSTTCAAMGGTYSGGVCNLAKSCSPSPSGATSGSYVSTTHTGGQQSGYTTTTTTFSCIDGTWVPTGTSSTTTEGTGSA